MNGLNGFNQFAQTAAPLLLGIGAQARGDTAGIARGMALMQAKKESDQRKAAIDNLMSGMGISGAQKDFLSSLPVELQQQYMLQQMAPKEPVRGVSIGSNLVNPYTGEVMADFGPEPLPPEVIQGIWGDATPVRQGIFAGESGGDYDALFGYSNRPGGAFEGTQLTNMTVDEAINFSAPSGEYGQWVKGQVGRVATPMGAYQVVGTTLRSAKDALGLTGNEKMTPELQERIGKWVHDTQGTGAWEGYRGPQSGGGKDAKADALRRSVETYELALAQGYDVSRLEPVYKRKLAELDELTSDPLVKEKAKALEAGLLPGTPEWQKYFMPSSTQLTVGPDGTVNFSQGAGGAKFNETESKTNTYTVRAKGALDVLDQVGAAALASRVDRGLEMVPGGIGRELQSEDYQVARQAGDEFLQAILRKDTGAAIHEHEQTMYGDTYLPRPGDGPRVLEAKRQARIRAIAALESGMSAAQQVATDRAIIQAEIRASEGVTGSPETADQLALPPHLQAVYEKYGAPTGR